MLTCYNWSLTITYYLKFTQRCFLFVSRRRLLLYSLVSLVKQIPDRTVSLTLVFALRVRCPRVEEFLDWYVDIVSLHFSLSEYLDHGRYHNFSHNIRNLWYSLIICFGNIVLFRYLYFLHNLIAECYKAKFVLLDRK